MTGHHGHQHAVRVDTDRRALAIALALILGFMAVEVVVGILASSLALISDAAHMLTDAGAIALSLFAARLAARPAQGALTYGMGRAEILSAQVNGLTLLLLAGVIVFEGVRRLIDPPQVDAAPVLVVGAGGCGRQPAGRARAGRRQPRQPERRGLLPARPHRPVRLHRHRGGGGGDPDHRLRPRRRARLAGGGGA